MYWLPIFSFYCLFIAFNFFHLNLSILTLYSELIFRIFLNLLLKKALLITQNHEKEKLYASESCVYYLWQTIRYLYYFTQKSKSKNPNFL